MRQSFGGLVACKGLDKPLVVTGERTSLTNLVRSPIFHFPKNEGAPYPDAHSNFQSVDLVILPRQTLNTVKVDCTAVRQLDGAASVFTENHFTLIDRHDFTACDCYCPVSTKRAKLLS